MWPHLGLGHIFWCMLSCLELSLQVRGKQACYINHRALQHNGSDECGNDRMYRKDADLLLDLYCSTKAVENGGQSNWLMNILSEDTDKHDPMSLKEAIESGEDQKCYLCKCSKCHRCQWLATIVPNMWCPSVINTDSEIFFNLQYHQYDYHRPPIPIVLFAQ